MEYPPNLRSMDLVDEELHQAIADLVDAFGLGPVKAEIKRRPAPRGVGDARIWHEMRLFTLWLIVETWALIEDGNISSACHQLEQAGGLVEIGFRKTKVLAKNWKRIRSLYYDANAALNNYEFEHKEQLRLRLPAIQIIARATVCI